MRIKFFISLIGVLLLYGTLYSNTVAMGDKEELIPELGCKWRKTLNIRIDGFSSGPEGSILTVNDQFFSNKQNHFDIDNIHQTLSSLEQNIYGNNLAGGKPNYIVADITLLSYGHDKKIISFTTKLGGQNRFVFVSGTTANAQKDHAVIINKEKHPLTLYDVREIKPSTRLVTFFQDRFPESAKTKLGLGVAISHFNEVMKTKDANLKKCASEGANYEIKYENITKELNGNLGTLYDSEQFLIYYLRSKGSGLLKDLILEVEDFYTKNYERNYKRLFDKYVFDSNKKILNCIDERILRQNGFQITVPYDESNPEVIEELIKLNNIKKYIDCLKYQRIGVILHLHSTYHICENCSLSIARELELSFQDETHPFSQLRKEIGDGAFFRITVSSRLNPIGTEGREYCDREKYGKDDFFDKPLDIRDESYNILFTQKHVGEKRETFERSFSEPNLAPLKVE